METERWVIYEYPGNGTDEAEVSWHRTESKAQAVADANHARTGLAYRVDLCWGSGGVARWECEGSEADVYGVGSGTRPVLPGDWRSEIGSREYDQGGEAIWEGGTYS
jgi:hypothetical protein